MKKMDDSRVKVLQDFVNKIEEHKNKSNQYVSLSQEKKKKTRKARRRTQIESAAGSNEKVKERLRQE